MTCSLGTKLVLVLCASLSTLFTFTSAGVKQNSNSNFKSEFNSNSNSSCSPIAIPGAYCPIENVDKCVSPTLKAELLEKVMNFWKPKKEFESESLDEADVNEYDEPKPPPNSDNDIQFFLFSRSHEIFYLPTTAKPPFSPAPEMLKPKGSSASRLVYHIFLDGWYAVPLLILLHILNNYHLSRLEHEVTKTSRLDFRFYYD